MSTTRAAIRQEGHDQLYAANRSFRRLRNGPDATGLTEFTSSMTTVVDTALQEDATLPVEFQGAWIRLKYVDDNGDTQERVSRISQFDRSTGTVTFSPAIGNVNGTAANVNGEYEIWPDVHPDEADNAINRILAVLKHTAYLPLTIIEDGDLEDSGVTNWTDVGSATQNKATNTLFPYGRQMLTMVAISSTNGVRTASMAVSPGEPLMLNVPVVATVSSSGIPSGSAKYDIILYDATNSENIKSVTPTDSLPVMVSFRESVPSDCELVQVRFVSNATASTETLNIGPVSLRSAWRDHYPLDSTSIERDTDILEVYRWLRGQNLQAADTYALYDRLEPIGFEAKTHEGRGGFPTAVTLGRDYDEPILLKVRQRHPTVSADSTTIAADKETVVNGLLYYLEKARGNERSAADFLRTFNTMAAAQTGEPSVRSHDERTLTRMDA